MRATVNANALTRAAHGGVALVNGAGLGRDASSTGVGRVFFTTAPQLVGATAPLDTGINAGAQDTGIVPFLVGEATNTTGGLGTVTGTADTFLTYDAVTGLRPLNPTDEFTQNAFIAGHNTRLTSNTTASASVAINSLLFDGGALTIAGGQTVDRDQRRDPVSSSGVTSRDQRRHAQLRHGRGHHHGQRRGRRQSHPQYRHRRQRRPHLCGDRHGGAGRTAKYLFGRYRAARRAHRSPLQFDGRRGRADQRPFWHGHARLRRRRVAPPPRRRPVIIGNAISFAVDTTIPTAGVGDKSITFTGPVTLTNGNRTLTQTSAASTVFSGDIGDAGLGLGLTSPVAGPVRWCSGATVPTTGVTAVKAGTLVGQRFALRGQCGASRRRRKPRRVRHSGGSGRWEM
ncbi:MAG: hypothetical protein WDN28_15105 [Chthoniobacter sp.]